MLLFVFLIRVRAIVLLLILVFLIRSVPYRLLCLLVLLRVFLHFIGSICADHRTLTRISDNILIFFIEVIIGSYIFLIVIWFLLVLLIQ